MGVPFEKANQASWTILNEARYIDNVDPVDIYDDTILNLKAAKAVIEGILSQTECKDE